jgi:GT2 family glycosyltransferase
MVKKDRLGFVLVTYGEGKKVNRMLNDIQKEKLPGDKVSLIDNHPDYKTAEVAEAHPVVDHVIRSPDNSGYAVGNVRAADLIEDHVDLLLFLNPDGQLEPGTIHKLRKGGKNNNWAAWMGLLVLEDGKTVNSAGNVVHISGLSWVNSFGKDASLYKEPQEVVVVSGADFVIKTEVWKKINRFPSIYYIYYEDTELSLDIQMLGYKIGMLPDAKVRHGYSFYNSERKWYLIERNRYIFIIRTWPLGVILVLLPLLLLTEVGLWGVSIIQRRFKLKVKSTYGAIKAMPTALRGRQEVRGRNRISNLEFFDLLTPKINTPLLPKILGTAPVNWFFVGYYKLARIILNIFSIFA